jgi:hypothetical protein
MLTSSRELTNIPISFSVLYEKEYNNLCLFLSLKKNKDKLGKRRAFTEVKYNSYSSQLNSVLISLKD